MTKLRHYDNLGTARFITFCCYNRYKLLHDECLCKIFVGNLRRLRDDYSIKIYGYVIIPEHIHLVLHPPDGIELGRMIGRLKALSSREILNHLREQKSPYLKKLYVRRNNKDIMTFWKPRCYDHNCRTPETVKEKINYCHKNPVLRGLVKHPGEWTWSSYNYYAGIKDVPLKMDDIIWRLFHKPTINCGAPNPTYLFFAINIISGESSDRGDLSKSPYSSVTLNPHRARRCSISYLKKYRNGKACTILSLRPSGCVT